MKKFSLTIGQTTRSVNANEYNVSPKTGEFKATVNGVESSAWTTSGRGKSAINNHYIYFKDGPTLYYTKSDASEVVEARKGFEATAEVVGDSKAAELANPGTISEVEAPQEMATLMAELSKPQSKRQRVAKAK